MADFLTYFMAHNAVALMIATPAVVYLILNPPSNWKD